MALSATSTRSRLPVSMAPSIFSVSLSMIRPASSPVFSMTKKAGTFVSSPEFKGDERPKQLYMPDTNVLLTRFLSPDGVGEITDFMPVGHMEEKKLIRRLTTIRGEPVYHLECRPRFNYGRDSHTAEQLGPGEILFHSDGLSIRLKAGVPLKIVDGDVVAEFALPAGSTTDILLEVADNKTSAGADIL